MDYDYVIKAGSVMTFALTAIALAEKAYQHENVFTGLWEDFKCYKAAYDRKVMADAMVICYGPQLDEDNIERVIADFRREISEADR